MGRAEYIGSVFYEEMSIESMGEKPAVQGAPRLTSRPKVKTRRYPAAREVLGRAENFPKREF